MSFVTELARRLADALAITHAITVGEVLPITAGEATRNFTMSTAQRQIFAKIYPADADLTAEEEAIRVCQYAAAGGVPTVTPIHSAHGRTIAQHAGLAFSLWPYIDAPSGEHTGLNQEQMGHMGSVVGLLHRRLANYPTRTAPRQDVRSFDIDATQVAIDGLLNVERRNSNAAVEARDGHVNDEFRAWALQALQQRRALLPRIAEIVNTLGRLHTQVCHGDLAAPNVLVSPGRVIAIVDFLPPRPIPAVHDISRIGLDPRSVVRLGDAWPSALWHLIDNYAQTNPELPIADLTGTVAWWVAYTGTSLYPIRRLLCGESPAGGTLEDYARLRHEALLHVAQNFDAVEADLRTVLRPRG
jgi:Ser/Thr protein kinase RdoA (MazF antagonist)